MQLQCAEKIVLPDLFINNKDYIIATDAIDTHHLIITKNRKATLFISFNVRNTHITTKAEER